MKICERCGNEHDGTYSSGRFCSRKCANTRIPSKETKEKISNALTGKKLSDITKKKIGDAGRNRIVSEETKRKIGKSITENNQKEITSIMQLSTRTITKVLFRMNAGCSRCGWNESTCDIHHINGRKIEDANKHENLCLLCPNCHRMAHTNKINKEELISLIFQVGDEWKKYYYGKI